MGTAGASARLGEALHRGQELLDLLSGLGLVPRRDCAGDAVLDVLVEDLERERFERRIDGGDLSQDLDAIAIFFEHPLDSAHLSLDAMKPLDEGVLLLGVAVHLS